MECLFGIEGSQTIINPIDWPEEGFTFPENESQRCSKANCYKKEVSYRYVPSKIQIRSLMAVSSSCWQKVTHTCNFNALSGFSSWIGSNGTSNSYWHGNKNSGNFKFFVTNWKRCNEFKLKFYKDKLRNSVCYVRFLQYF